MSAKPFVITLIPLFTFIQRAHADAAPAADTASPMAMIMQILPMMALFVFFYLFFIRPQAKRTKEHRAMIDGIKEGNEVIFASGLMGRIKKIQGDYAVIELDTNHSVKIQRASILSVLPAGTLDGLN